MHVFYIFQAPHFVLSNALENSVSSLYEKLENLQGNQNSQHKSIEKLRNELNVLSDIILDYVLPTDCSGLKMQGKWTKFALVSIVL